VQPATARLECSQKNRPHDGTPASVCRSPRVMHSSQAASRGQRVALFLSGLLRFQAHSSTRLSPIVGTGIVDGAPTRWFRPFMATAIPHRTAGLSVPMTGATAARPPFHQRANQDGIEICRMMGTVEAVLVGTEGEAGPTGFPTSAAAAGPCGGQATRREHRPAAARCDSTGKGGTAAVRCRVHGPQSSGGGSPHRARAACRSLPRAVLPRPPQAAHANRQGFNPPSRE
jgi:hypothetical protein